MEYIKDKLQAALKPERYRHSLGVCSEAVKLAKRYGADENKAYTAGLLHDCAKGMSIDEQINECHKRGVELDNIMLKCPAVIHAPLGAAVAADEYGINDSEILEAIRYHTTAKADMTTLDKIIYLADMIEPSRSFDGVELLRKTAYEDLDTAVLEAIRQSIFFNLKKNAVIHPKTLEAWNDLVKGR